MSRIIHACHPNSGNPHPFKALTLCCKMVRFGGFTGKVSCKICLKIQETICHCCGGTGIKGAEPTKEGGTDE